MRIRRRPGRLANDGGPVMADQPVNGPPGAKGHPLVALMAVLAGWTAGRAAEWQAPLPDTQASAAPLGIAGRRDVDAPFVVDTRMGPQSSERLAAGPDPRRGLAAFPAGAARCCNGAAGPSRALSGMTGPERSLGLAALPLRPVFAPDPRSDRYGVVAAPWQRASGTVAVAPAPASPPARPRRWSMDAWALFRGNGGGALSPGVLPGTYGASQSGAVTRYRIDLSSPYRPTAYLRTTAALGGTGESTAALGLSARPAPALPVVAAAEARWTRFPGGSVVQPAVFAYTEMPPITLPAGLRAEVYAQGGYVGGRFPTPFADGQVRIDRRAFAIGAMEARVGGGVWGGAQTGVARLDAGPSATVAMPLGRGLFGRVAVDWRFRVAGNARPPSGPAVTLSAGF